jgi:ankyrin repeat protein
MLQRITDGRTDLVFDHVSAGGAATMKDGQGVSLLQWCAYYGDVSAMRHLLANGASLSSLGENLDLNGAAFHGHWRLCQFLLENGAKAGHSDPVTGETPLHSALCKDRAATLPVVRLLLAHGADPNAATKPGMATDAFMRDSRTKGETPLHRAAAFGSEEVLQLLLDAGAKVDAKDMNGDTPLAWASWHLRPAAVLRKLCYGPHSIRPGAQSMELNLLGTPHLR